MGRRKKTSGKGDKEILINVGPVEKRVAILRDGELADFFLEREGSENYAGSIYKGKVSSIIPGIEAAFVDIGMEKNGFLHVSDVVDKGNVLRELLPGEEAAAAVKKSSRKRMPKIGSILKQGEEIMVQVVKEAISTKGPRLTSFISLPGRYIVLTPFDPSIGISRRISEREERNRIRGIVKKMKFPDGMGCIVRTVAENRSEKELISELKYLMNLWDRIRGRADREKAPVTVYEEYGVVLKMIRDKFTEDISRLVVDSKEEYNRIIKFLKAFMPSLRKKVKLYNSRAPLFQKYDLEKRIDQIFERKVPLKSGGYLIIEQTEALVVIDVNTGSYTGRKSLEQTAFKTNIEAAEEIPKQLLLRDMGGIIIIDFIDMEVRSHRDRIFSVLQENLQNDKARISLRAISQFGIVEMTRQRMQKSLESTSHIECPYCRGKGVVKSAETIAIGTARKIDRALSLSEKKIKDLKVTVHPGVYEAMVSNQARMLSDIQRKYRCKIEIREDSTFHIEDVVIEER
ncbi:MAG: Rne/Rng family ribonuclease [Candidatus Omnitrophica bacterium]|nr:Rne/Rng family ribonuclease [Candidatus Omnitrophota bacterium]